MLLSAVGVNEQSAAELTKLVVVKPDCRGRELPLDLCRKFQPLLIVHAHWSSSCFKRSHDGRGAHLSQWECGAFIAQDGKPPVCDRYHT
jgi:hypothetical protein